MATARTGIKRIVVGVDGSEQCQAALKWAIRMAKAMGSQITAVYAIDMPVYFPQPYGIPVQFDEKWRGEIKAEFEKKWCKPLISSGVRFRTVMEDGRPASVIAAVADRVEADLLVVGRRGLGGVGEFLLGSVSHELVLNSKRPVLLISPEKKTGRR
jgi:nucleotide-binding universal stress UspA family protein